MTSTLRRWAPALAAIVALAAGLFALDASPVGVFVDDAHYVLLGKALATGEGYRYLNLPDRPFATHYPPGYPALLALLWRIAPQFPANVVVFKLANVALVAIAAVVVLRFARDRLALADGAALVTVAAAVATIPMLFVSSMVLSESLFIALLMPLLCWAERVAARERAAPSPAASVALVRIAALGAAMGLLALVRSHGIVLPFAFALVLLAHRRWREAAAVVIASLAVLLPWLLFVARHDAAFAGPLLGGYGSYTAWLRAGVAEQGVGLLAATARGNVGKIVNDTALYLQLGPSAAAHALAIAATVVVAAVGVVAFARRAPVTLSFFACYLAIVVVWPFWPMRFVFAVWPLVALLLAAGLADSWRRRTASPFGRALRIGVCACGGLLAAGMCASSVVGYRQSWWSSLARANTHPLRAELAWVALHSTRQEVIGTVNQPAVFLYTGRSAVPIGSFTAGDHVVPRSAAASVEAMRALLRRYPPDLVIATTPETRSAAEALARADAAALVAHDTLPGLGVAYRRVPSVMARREPTR